MIRATTSLGLFPGSLIRSGVPIVNHPLLKGVATDDLYPSRAIPYGQIQPSPILVETEARLSWLGIRYVVAIGGERIAPGLKLRFSETVDFGGDSKEVRILENPSYRSAIALDPAASEIAVPIDPRCGHDRALCSDFMKLASFVRESFPEVTVAAEQNRIEIRLASPAPSDTLLWLPHYHRPEWKDPRHSRSVFRLGGAFTGVVIREGETQVNLVYAPGARAWSQRLTQAFLALVCLFVPGYFLFLARKPAMFGQRVFGRVWN
jgi:hypothetical protein